jgi:RNA polymerase sigma-70 factor, ECF subfamily
MSDLRHFYERFIEPIEARMKRSVWRITRNLPDAEDAMHNALLVIWERRHAFESHKAPQALVLKICADAACDIVRRRARDRRMTAPGELGDRVAVGALSPSENLASREFAEELVTAINKLSRSQAAAITLRIFDELPYEQIAAALGCSEATARKHVELAKTRLRAVLIEHAPNHVVRSQS